MVWNLVEVLQAFRATVDTGNALISLVKSSKEAKAKGEEFENELEGLKCKFRLFETQIAHGLGFQICRCAFPPQICTKVGFDEIGNELSRCPVCQQEYPIKQCQPILTGSRKRYGDWMRR